MRVPHLGAVCTALVLSLVSCTEGGVGPLAPGESRLATTSSSLPPRISEIHYDNGGTDQGEAVEVSFPVGTDLTGYRIVRFNGSTTTAATVYTSPAPVSGSSETLSELTPTLCEGGARAVVVVRYPSNGLQNGGSDGLALVNGSTVVELLSYEGTFTVASTAAVAAGMQSTDIGVAEVGTEIPGGSLQRDAANVWTVTATHSFDACNDADEVPPAEVATVTVAPASVAVGATTQLDATALDADGRAIPGVAFSWTTSDAAVATVSAAGIVSGVAEGSATITATAPNGVLGTATVTVTPGGAPAASVFVSEFHYDDAGADTGEAIELEGDAGSSLAGWTLVLYNGSTGSSTRGHSYATIELGGAFPSTAPGSCVSGRAVLTIPAVGLQNGDSDGFALVNAAGTVVEFLSYEGSFTALSGVAAGMTSTDVGVSQSGSPEGRSLQRAGNGVWFGPATSSFDACNPAPPPAPPSGLVLEGYSFRGTTPLPVGFGELYRVKDTATNDFVRTGLVFTSSAPSVATIDALGNVTAVGVGTTTLGVTETATGRSASFSLSTTTVEWSDTSVYADELQFGRPGDAGILVNRATFAAAWSPALGQPSWVAYNLEGTHRLSGGDRCDCFIQDPQLPSDIAQVTTADYDGSTYSRGHLAMSADRTRGAFDNATTFYFSNIIPQTSQNNGGPWLELERHLGDLAVTHDKEIFIFAGGAAHSGSLNGAGRVAIPTRTWKVAVILDRNEGVGDVSSPSDVEIIAVDMPNSTSMPSSRWEDYRVTVDQVEALTGLDFLSALPDAIEGVLETRAPIARTDGPYLAIEGSAVKLSASASTDPDGDALSYAWSFGDGGTATGVSPTHTYADNGTYPVTVTVTDANGASTTATTAVTVVNVAPVVGQLAGATLLPGESYSAGVSFVDPGSDEWTATVSYGDGAAAQPVTLSGKTFSISHVYPEAGSYTVTVTVTDDDGDEHAVSAVVTVLSHQQSTQRLLDRVSALEAEGALSKGEASSLAASLRAAAAQIDRGGATAAANQLRAYLNKVEAQLRSGRLSAEQAGLLTAEAIRLIESLSRG